MLGKRGFCQWKTSKTPIVVRHYGLSYWNMSDRTTEVQELDRYVCQACGYIYEPKEGYSQGNIAPGTAFEDIPQKWRCPVCSSPKAQFKNIGANEGPSGFKENLGYGLGVNNLTASQKNLLIFGGLALGFLLLLSLYGLQ